MIETWYISLGSAVVGGAIASLPLYMSERRTNDRFDADLQTNALRIDAESLKSSLVPVAGLISAMAYCVAQQYEETGETPDQKYLRLLAFYNNKNSVFEANMGAMIVDPRIGSFEPLMVRSQVVWKEYMCLRLAGQLSGPEDENYIRISDEFAAIIGIFMVESRQMLAVLNTPIMTSDISHRFAQKRRRSANR